MSPPGTRVDHNALRTNQAFIIGLTLLAFLLDSAPLVALVGAIMLAGSISGRPGFLLAYRALRRLGWIEPDVLPDHPEPHRFSQTIGGLFLAGGTVALAFGLAPLGWALAWVVVALAALNLFGGFCVGCAAYYWLHRLGAPGFTKAPAPGITPGRVPDADAWEQRHV